MPDESDIPPEVVELVRESSPCLQAATAVDVAEEIVRNAAGPIRIQCPCCGMPDAVTPERVVDYLRHVLFGGETR